MVNLECSKNQIFLIHHSFESLENSNQIFLTLRPKVQRINRYPKPQKTKFLYLENSRNEIWIFLNLQNSEDWSNPQAQKIKIEHFRLSKAQKTQFHYFRLIQTKKINRPSNKTRKTQIHYFRPSKSHKINQPWKFQKIKYFRLFKAQRSERYFFYWEIFSNNETSENWNKILPTH